MSPLFSCVTRVYCVTAEGSRRCFLLRGIEKLYDAFNCIAEYQGRSKKAVLLASRSILRNPMSRILPQYSPSSAVQGGYPSILPDSARLVASGMPTLWSLLCKEVLKSQEVKYRSSRPSAAMCSCVLLDRVQDAERQEVQKSVGSLTGQQHLRVDR